MRIRIALVAVVLAGLTVAPSASAKTTRGTYLDLYEQVGPETAGRNIVRYGIRNPGGVETPTRSELEASIGVMRRILNPPPPPPPSPPVFVASAAAAPAQAPTGVAYPSGGGCGPGYRGLYQFDCQTWRSVGGSGDPAAASPQEQRERAATLQSQRGNQPWPVCGRGGASLAQIEQCESGGDPTAVG